jgi:hypothetical protein
MVGKLAASVMTESWTRGKRGNSAFILEIQRLSDFSLSANTEIQRCPPLL